MRWYWRTRPSFAVDTAAMRSDDHVRGVAHNRDISGADLPDLCRINVRVDHLRVRGEQRRLAGYSVIKAGTERDEEVGLLQREHSRNRTVHAGHSHVLRVRVREHAAGHQRGHDWGAHELRRAAAAPRRRRRG